MENARALYKNDVDFEALALQSSEFAKQQLTISLLQRDFGLKVKLPEDRLCPPVPNRLNYILWIQDLLDSTTGSIRRSYDPNRKVSGLDIGTGCCSIYPLLGCKTRDKWKFFATDIDENNIETARANVELNGLESRISILQTSSSGPFFPLNRLGTESLDFTMCNPPFYSSHEEMTAAAELKTHAPHSTCTGADVEMITPGGEAAFVTRMIEESLELRAKIQWFTSMLGKLSSVTTLVEALMERDNHNYAVAEFVQGNKTKRWAVAWSWGDMRPSMTSARGIPGFPKHLLPFPADYTFTLSSTTYDSVMKTMNADLGSLPWYWNWDQSLSAGVGFASGNVWSRQARRKLKIAGEQAPMANSTSIPTQVELGVRVQLKLTRVQESTNNVEVLISWIRGTDSLRVVSGRFFLEVQVVALYSLKLALAPFPLSITLNSHTMSKLSSSLKALINSPAARPHTVPAPANIVSVYSKIQQTAQAQQVSSPSWIALSTAATMTMNSPESLAALYQLASTSLDKVQAAELMREVGLKCISFNGIPRSINCLNAFKASLPENVTSQLSTIPTRLPTPANITAISERGQAMWDSIYRPFDKKLYNKLGDSHPDLPVHILHSNYGALLSGPAVVGRVLTSIVAVACLRAQTGVGPQVVSHVFGLRKALEDGTWASDVESEQGMRWLASDEGNTWILNSVDSIVEAISEGNGSNFAPGKAKL
ncbi:hypothetical protein N7488_010276 [Penicillium malachiteum]|nr:hypothetical protein N7488_010276 [Penicillium malachiteum]